jgi:hypothetical protein
MILPQIARDRTSEGPCLSPAELEAAIRRALSGSEGARLRGYSARLVAMYKLQPIHGADDVLQEAQRRILSRPRSRDLDIHKFLMGAVKSTAWVFFKKKKMRGDFLTDAETDLTNFEDSATSPDAQLIAREEYLEIRSSLHDDPVAQIVLDGIVIGHEGKALQELTGLDETGLASKRRKIVRRLKGDKHD